MKSISIISYEKADPRTLGSLTFDQGVITGIPVLYAFADERGLNIEFSIFAAGVVASWG
jgi:hypothetical protein